MKPASKEKLLRDLVFHRQAFLTALAALTCLSQSENVAAITKRPISISGPDIEDGLQFDLRPIQRALKSAGRDKVLRNFLKTALRTVVRDSHEAIWQYCKATDGTGNMELLRDQPWFDILRLIRDAFSHDAKWVFDEKTKNAMPIEWKKIRLDKDQEGTRLQFEQIPLTALFDLLAVAEQFVHERLQ